MCYELWERTNEHIELAEIQAAVQEFFRHTSYINVKVFLHYLYSSNVLLLADVLLKTNCECLRLVETNIADCVVTQ